MEAQGNLLETLTEPQQFEVYNLMAMANIEDGNIAARFYIDANYDINRAAQLFLDRQAGISHTTPATNQRRVENVPQNARNAPPQRARNNNPGESDLHRQYRRHIQRKAREEAERGYGESFKGGIGSMMSGVKNVWNTIMPVAIRGETLGGEQFTEYFKREYADLAKVIKFKKGTFEENILQANIDKKPLLVFLHVDAATFRPIPNNIFRNKKLLDVMNAKFNLLGLLMNTQESQKILKYIETKFCPCLAVFRTNLFDETILVEFIALRTDTIPEQVFEQLRGIEKNYYTIEIEENKIKVDVRRSLEAGRASMQYYANVAQNNGYEEDQMFGFFDGVQQQPQRRQPNPEEQQRLEEARILRQVQDEEFKEVERKILEQQQKQAEEEKTRKEKAEQEAIAKAQKEEEERTKAEQKELTKKLKLERVPIEPTEDGPDVMLVIFRLPDGNRAERRFRVTDKVEVLYDYVDTQDVQFDSSTIRYDLMQPRPFLCLEDREKTIGEYFEGSNHEVIHVRELTA